MGMSISYINSGMYPMVIYVWYGLSQSSQYFGTNSRLGLSSGGDGTVEAGGVIG